MVKKISEPMLVFLQDYLAWAEANAKIESTFSDHHALCVNMITWASSESGHRLLTGRGIFFMRWELNVMLERSHLNTCFPFGRDAYKRERDEQSHHRNPDRLEWIRKQLAK